MNHLNQRADKKVNNWISERKSFSTFHFPLKKASPAKP
jgi:hypothetical protein